MNYLTFLLCLSFCLDEEHLDLLENVNVFFDVIFVLKNILPLFEVMIDLSELFSRGAACQVRRVEVHNIGKSSG
jgi:hypothetical protein